MMDFKKLHKILHQRKLLDKSLGGFDVVEMRELWLAFLEACTSKHKICANCKHQSWEGNDPDPWCLHPDHPARMYSFTYQLACPDWQWWKEKTDGESVSV